MARETYQAGAGIKEGQEVWLLDGLPFVWPKPLIKNKGDEYVGVALEDAEAYGLVVVEVK
jgi:hypothetical protein